MNEGSCKKKLNEGLRWPNCY